MSMRYDENIRVLQKTYPNIQELIDEALEKNEDTTQIRAFETGEAIRGVILEKDGIEYYMHGKRQPERPIEKWYSGMGILQKNAPVFIMGLANPLYLKYIAEKTENSITIVVYEPSINIFIDFLNNVDISKWMDKHTIIFWVEALRGMSLEGYRGIVGSLITYAILPLARMYVLPNYNEIYPEKTLKFVQTYHEIAKMAAVQFSTLKVFSHSFAKNLLYNVRWLCNQYKTTQLLKVVPKDITGIVVAAGPSLNKNICELKAAKNKAFIIAVDTAIKPLLREGIVPDMFVIVDAEKPIDLIKIEGAEKIPLSTVIDAPADILNFHKGQKFFANEGIKFVDHILEKYEQQYGRATDGGSVATAAFSLLYRLGINRIILVGQDLAFTNNKSHADGTFEEVMKEEDTEGFEMVKGNTDDEVPTRYDFKIYLEWYAKFIKTVKEMDDNFKVINATEGGAYIEGTEVMSLKEAIARECDRELNFEVNFANLKPMFEGEDRIWVRNQIESLPEEFKHIMDEAKKAKENYITLGKICDKHKMDETAYLKTLKKINNLIQRIESHDVYQIIKLTMNEAEYIILNEQFITYDSNKEEGKELSRQGVILMNGIYECAKIYRDYVLSLDYEWDSFM